MDRLSAVVVSICIAILVFWYIKVIPQSREAQRAAAAERAESVATSTNATNSTVQEGRDTGVEAETVSGGVASQLLGSDKTTEALAVFENDEAIYTLSSHGGGIASVALKGITRETSCREETTTGSSTNLVQLQIGAPVPIFGIQGAPAIQGDGIYEVAKTVSGLRASKELENGLRVVKDIEINEGRLLTSRLTLSNTSEQPIVIPEMEIVIGTASPIGSDTRRNYRNGIVWFDGDDSDSKNESWFANRTLGCFQGTPREVYRLDVPALAWVGAKNQFFGIVGMPSTNSLPTTVMGRRVILDDPYYDETADGSKRTSAPVGYQSAMLYPQTVIQPGQSLEKVVEIYAGPKEYKVLAKLGSQMGNDLDLLMDFGFFGLFSKILLLGMNLLNSWGLAYGLSIVAITVIIKALFWPLTQASTRSMKRMSALQPQMKEIQAKYKDDPRKMNQKMMEFMRDNKVNPLGGCLPIMIQIPVFMGFFFMIQNAIELRGASFLWACDLSQPDTVFVIPGINFPINLFPLLMAGSQFWQMRLTPPSPGMDPMQQKMMQYMPLIFVVFLYNFSSGLTLYWTVQNLLSILQMKLTRNEPVTAVVAGAGNSSSASTPIKGSGARQRPKKRKK